MVHPKHPSSAAPNSSQSSLHAIVKGIWTIRVLLFLGAFYYFGKSAIESNVDKILATTETSLRRNWTSEFDRAARVYFCGTADCSIAAIHPENHEPKTMVLLMHADHESGQLLALQSAFAPLLISSDPAEKPSSEALVIMANHLEGPSITAIAAGYNGPSTQLDGPIWLVKKDKAESPDPASTASPNPEGDEKTGEPHLVK